MRWAFVWEGRQGLLDTEWMHLPWSVSLVRLSSLSKPLKAMMGWSGAYRHRRCCATPALRSLLQHLADDDYPIRQAPRDSHGDQLPFPERSTASRPPLEPVRNATGSLIGILRSLGLFLISRPARAYIHLPPDANAS